MKSRPAKGHLTWVCTRERDQSVLAQGSRDVEESIDVFGAILESEAEKIALPDMLALMRDADAGEELMESVKRIYENMEAQLSKRGTDADYQVLTLASGYTLELPIRLDQCATGFGMSVEMGDDEIGLFEWFELRESCLAVHSYQGAASNEELGLSWRRSGPWLEISRIDFRSAVSFRVALMSDGRPTREILTNPPIRLSIAAGSWVEFLPA